MAKISGLIETGKVGSADPKVVAAMPLMGKKPAVPKTLQPINRASNSVAMTKAPEDSVQEIPIDHIRRSPYQVRAMGDENYIESLMESIVDSGVISPIVVRPLPVEAGSSNFELFEFIAGEHRAQACKRLGHNTIKAIVRNMNDKAAAIALATDNAVRKNLDDFDRYQHARMLRKNGFCRTDSEVAITLGMSKSHVSMLSAFDGLSVEAQAVLRANPGILGAAYAYKLRDLIASHSVLITRALESVALGNLKQNGIRAWISSHTRSHLATENRTTIKIDRPGLPTVSLVISDNEAVIKCASLNTEKLRELLEANLDHLLTVS
jgi:ParB family chromosome partitioning protein